MELHEPIWTTEQTSPTRQFQGESLRVDTVVIGAGLTGLSSACHLLQAQPDKELIVLESQQIGAGASTRSTGMLTPGIGQNLAALSRKVGADKARAMYNKTLWAVEYVEQLSKELAIDCEIDMTGQLITARGPKGSSRLLTQAKTYAELGLPHKVVSHSELEELVHLNPVSAAAEEAAAIRLPVAGTLHPGRLLDGLARQVTKLGGTIYEKAKVLDISDGQPATITLEGGGKVIADEVILATSGYTPDLKIFRGRVLPVHLSVLLTEPLSQEAMDILGWKGRECIIDSRRLFNYFRLTKDNRIIFGGGLPRYHWGGSTYSDSGKMNDLDDLLAEFNSTIPDEIKPAIDRSWSGLIDYVLDTLPVIQRLTDKPAVTHVGGWCGHGVAMSVASGAWVAHLLSKGEPPEALPWFRSKPPMLPFESVRWLGFRATTRVMALMDRM